MDRDGEIDPNERYVGPNHAIDALKAWVWTDPTFAQLPAITVTAPPDLG